ncbi:MAG: 2-keto-4-pentenoate hydratase [Alphaproteobacteria bacterium]
MTPEAIDEAVSILERARLEGGAIEALPEHCRPRDVDEAYALQAALNQRLAAQLGPVVGHKIGCTNKRMQEYIGINSPASGSVHERMVKQLRGEFRHGDLVHPGVECEIAARLSTALPPARAPYTREAVAEAVDTLMPCFEIVDARFKDFRNAGTPSLIADDFFDVGCVLGAPVVNWRKLDLAKLKGEITINGKLVSSGLSGDVMGHPFEALAWLANELARRGRGLKAGEFVTTGSICDVIWVNPGETAIGTIESLGSITARF